jgi:hypothetical protein
MLQKKTKKLKQFTIESSKVNTLGFLLLITVISLSHFFFLFQELKPAR